MGAHEDTGQVQRARIHISSHLGTVDKGAGPVGDGLAAPDSGLSLVSLTPSVAVHRHPRALARGGQRRSRTVVNGGCAVLESV